MGFGLFGVSACATPLYTDSRTAFNANLQPGSTTLDFNSVILDSGTAPNIYKFSNLPAGLTEGGVNFVGTTVGFNNETWFTGPGYNAGLYSLNGTINAMGGRHMTQITPPAGTSAIGFDLGESNTNGQTNVDIYVLQGATRNRVIANLVLTHSGQFAGFLSDDGSPITQIEIDSTVQTGLIPYHLFDNLVYGSSQTPIALPPVAQSQNTATERNTTKSLALLATDAGNHPLTYAVLTQPAHGIISGTAPDVVYWPDANFVGNDSFTFRVDNGTNNSNAATVNITVTAPNQGGQRTVTTLLDDGSPGTLRSQILAATERDTILFQSGLRGTIMLNGTMLTISKNLAIQGPGMGVITISGEKKSPVLSIESGPVGISGLTIANGKSAFNAGGGIVNSSNSLSLSNCLLSSNTAYSGGGGIFNRGELTVSNCLFASNSASNGQGGGIYNTSGELTMSNSLLFGNSATDGGAIYNDDNGVVTVNGSNLGDNNSSHDGGAIYNLGPFPVTITNSTLSNNSAANTGGGICSHDGPLTVSRCTLSNNSAALGGGLASFGTLVLGNSTLNGNQASMNGGGLYNGLKMAIANCTIWGNSAVRGGGMASLGTEQTLNNSIVAGNSATYSPDAYSGALLGDYNIVMQVPTPLAAAHNQIGVDPMLGPLNNNGGSLQTQALLPGSPAINAGDPAFNPSTTPTDQRGIGFARVSGAALDIGAFEVQ